MKKRRIGVDIGGTRISFIDFYTPEKIIAQKSINTPKRREEIISVVVETVREMISAFSGDKPGGIGIGLAGQINPADKSILFSPHLPFKEEFPFGKMIEDALELPVVLENDANAAAIGEKVFGSAKDMDDFIVLTLGTGIGSGIFTGGKILHGCQSSGGEAGHIIIDSKGPLCACGQRGCLEAFASGSAITNMAKLEMGKALTAKEVCQAAESRDEKAIAILEKAGGKLGDGLVSLINIFNPEAIFFAGSLANAPKCFFDPAFKKARENSFGTMGKMVRLEISSLKDNLGPLGAAAMV